MLSQVYLLLADLNGCPHHHLTPHLSLSPCCLVLPPPPCPALQGCVG
jgi:hypothetical protein